MRLRSTSCEVKRPAHVLLGGVRLARLLCFPGVRLVGSAPFAARLDRLASFTLGIGLHQLDQVLGRTRSGNSPNLAWRSDTYSSSVGSSLYAFSLVMVLLDARGPPYLRVENGTHRGANSHSNTTDTQLSRDLG
jgi:hypothetical protein